MNLRLEAIRDSNGDFPDIPGLSAGKIQLSLRLLTGFPTTKGRSRFRGSDLDHGALTDDRESERTIHEK
jgi:hypothetical protein